MRFLLDRSLSSARRMEFDKLEFGGQWPLTMRAQCSVFRYCPDPLGTVTAVQLDKLEFGEVRMKIEKCTKDAFVVIGKEGSTLDGQGFIQKLWTDANSHFSEVQPLAKKDENGNLVGIWGAMSDCSHSYKPWEENFSKGLYLAGVECVDDAEAPEGWTKWKIPGYEYLYAEVESESTFSIVLDYMNTNNIVLAGAVHDFTCPLDGKNYMFFPIRTI